MKSVEILKERADSLGSWRYDHRECEFIIKGDLKVLASASVRKRSAKRL